VKKMHRWLNDKTASIGFIYRHIGETMNLFGQFFGIPTDVINTTMGQTDIGQVFDHSEDAECVSRLPLTFPFGHARPCLDWFMAFLTAEQKKTRFHSHCIW
jgi:hypothetical protein